MPATASSAVTMRMPRVYPATSPRPGADRPGSASAGRRGVGGRRGLKGRCDVIRLDRQERERRTRPEPLGRRAVAEDQVTNRGGMLATPEPSRLADPRTLADRDAASRLGLEVACPA